MEQNTTSCLFSLVNLVIEFMLSIEVEDRRDKACSTVNLSYVCDIAAVNLVSGPVLLLTLCTAVPHRGCVVIEVIFTFLTARGETVHECYPWPSGAVKSMVAEVCWRWGDEE
jgi:hypothetical protein